MPLEQLLQADCCREEHFILQTEVQVALQGKVADT